jgi:ComF family protein
MKYVERLKPCQPGRLVRVDGLLDFLFPPRCLLCGLQAGPEGICDYCRGDLPWNRSACRACGLPIPATAGRACGPCLRRAPPWDSAIAALRYEFPVREMIRKFKFNRHLASGRVLSCLLASCIGQRLETRPELLIPVPLHGLRLLRRGFNQAYEIARHLGKALDVPLSAADLRRTRRTRSQSGLDADARRGNLRNAFCWRGRSLTGMHVVLIDDVMTTGATLHECTRVLRRSGAKRIDAWVVARALRHR